MSNSYHHAQSSARKWGGTPEDYLPIHEFIDGSKRAFGDVRHRALLHNTFGVWVCQEVFGRVLTVRRDGIAGTTGTVTDRTKVVPVREIAERHIEEDLGFIPSPGDWLEHMNIVTWMGGKRHRFVGREEVLNSIVKEGKK
ncbi:MAG: hypothetical protein JWO67_4483 [Streptosporangiaceae bacterium]|nr:hypothetical protein [Streptosporangiaceae bacterium]